MKTKEQIEELTKFLAVVEQCDWAKNTTMLLDLRMFVADSRGEI